MALTAPDATVVVPAHNESSVIGRTLDALLAQDYPGAIQVVVAANGCSDDTAAVARGFEQRLANRDWQMCVEELPEAGKPGALNRADSLARSATRIYLDADVTLSPTAVSALLGALEHDGVEFAAPSMRPLPPRSAVVRAYVDVWSSMPYVRESGPGRGVFAISPEGRSRWGEFPDVLADDTFARLHFQSSEVAITDQAFVEVRFPSDLGELVAVRSRKFRGLEELRARYPELMSQDEPRQRVALETIARNPRLWLKAPVFFGVYGLGRRHARRAEDAGDAGWGRADSSRGAP